MAGLALVATGLAGPVYAANSPSLGAAGSFSALAGVAMSAAAPGTTVAHDIGLSPGLESSRTGNWTVAGSQYFGPLTLAGTAQSAALGAFNNLATQGSDGTWSLNPAPLPGVWTAASSATFAGPKLTLDGGYDDVWVFQIGADFTFTGSVALTGNAQPCHVFWQVGGDATIASGSTFAGTLIASGNVTVVSGATVNGRIISLNGALTTDGNNISGPTCLTAPPVTPASLHVIKVVNNDNGGSKSASDFSFMINGGTATAFQTGGENDLSLAPGTYSVTEPAGLGYSTTYDNCSNLAIASGALATCIITNDDRAPSLTLDKIVVNDDGGTAAESDWVLTAAGPTLISGHGAAGSADVVSGPTFLAGTYTLSESTGPTGYNASPWSCAKNGAAPVNGPQIVLDVGDSAICTITNDDIDPQAGQAATLHIIKHVSNNNGGTLSAKDFSFSVNGGTAQAFEADGQNDLTVSAGTYSVIEQAVAGYTTSYDNCSNLAISAGGSATCTITNDDIAPSLTLDKIVINNNGGNVSESAWTLTADGGTAGTLSGPGAAGSADVQSGNNFKAGTYALSESVGPAGYSASAWSCVKNQNQPVASALITLGLGDKATCTITNTYNVLVSGVSGGGNGSAYTLPVPPLIDVVKIPSPLTLPAGPGPVTYTYILRNIGTVGVTNITLADDACNPVTLVAGDINTDSQLETNETWTYRCSTTLAATRTNTVVATGWANSISATDTASATVVVGAQIEPPLIHVTKIPFPLALLNRGGLITYDEKVTNPGTVALSNVTLTDDKCGPVMFISGDMNGNSKLDANETWTYLCQARIDSTTTNTAVATGEANGMVARDSATATVVAANPIPALPNAGFPPTEKSTPWGIIMICGILAFISISFAIIRRRRAIWPGR